MFDRELTKGNKSFRKGGVDPAKVNQIIEDGYAVSARETKVRVKQSYAPSSIGYGKATCARYWYLAFEGKYVFDESGTDNKALANMTNGTEVHARLNKVFEDSGALVESEMELRMDDPPVFGFIDAILNVDDEHVVIEVKSAKSEMFNNYLIKQKGAAYHMYQILLYLKGTGLKNGALVYENKNDQSILTIPVSMNEYNEKAIEEALEWMRMVRKNWEDGKDGVNLPKRPWTQKNVKCKQCPLFDECWNNLPEGTVEIKPMAVADF